MSPKFLLIISIFITIFFNNNNSEHFDSNPCKKGIKVKSIAPIPRSMFDLIGIINKEQKELKCQCIVENGGKFSLHRCFLPKLENFYEGKMTKLAMRFRILNSTTTKKIDANIMSRNISFMEGAFLDDYYGPIDLNCSSLEMCFSDKWRPFYGEQISIRRTKKGLNISIMEKEQEVINPQPCPNCPPCLVGKWPMNKTEPNNWAEVEAKYPNVKNASWKPKECIQKERMRIAIVIPHRNRTKHLKMLLNNLHTFLQKQQADYRIFVADQAYPEDGTKDKFNKAKLLNAAFMEIQKRWGKNDATDCYIFHDVDLVPDYDTNIYRCDQHGPIRLYSAADEWNYAESGDRIVGGICSQTGQQFVKANGFANVYWGWGNEDDDMRERYRASNQPVEFVQSPLGYYSSLELVVKPDDPTNPKISDDCNKKLIAWRQKCWQMDGLNNLIYKKRRIEYNKLYTNISIDVLMEKSKIKQPHPCGNEINQKGAFRKTFVKYKDSNLGLRDMQNIKCT